MAYKSRKALLAEVARLHNEEDLKLVRLPKTPEEFSNETYGPASMIYLDWISPEVRQKAEQILEDRGFAVQRGYSPGSATSSVRVSYFKGYHWDE